MELANDLYEELIEFLEDQEDADCKGDPPQYIPNRAMSLLQRLRPCESAERVAQDAANRAGTSHREMSPGTLYDLAQRIIDRDDRENQSTSKILRPGLTDEYRLAQGLLDARIYVTALQNNLEEVEMNCEANAEDAENLRKSREKLLRICEAVAKGYTMIKTDESLQTTARKLYESLTMLPV